MKSFKVRSNFLPKLPYAHFDMPIQSSPLYISMFLLYQRRHFDNVVTFFFDVHFSECKQFIEAAKTFHRLYSSFCDARNHSNFDMLSIQFITLK